MGLQPKLELELLPKLELELELKLELKGLELEVLPKLLPKLDLEQVQGHEVEREGQEEASPKAEQPMVEQPKAGSQALGLSHPGQKSKNFSSSPRARRGGFADAGAEGKG